MSSQHLHGLMNWSVVEICVFFLHLMHQLDINYQVVCDLYQSHALLTCVVGQYVENQY